MNQLTLSDLKELAADQPGLVVSIYMPTHRAGADTQQDPIRLRNLLQRAEERLLELGLRRPDARDLLKEPRRRATDDLFWGEQSDGLAVLAGSQYCASFRLPLRFEELVVVDKRFHLKPLLPLLGGDGRFCVLALSQNAVRLLECTRYGVRQVDLGEAPRSLAEALQWDEFERSLQFRSAAGPASHGRGAAVFYGHADDIDQAKSGLTRYLQAIDHGLGQHLAGRHTPVVLAGVTYLQAMYREISRCQQLTAEGLDGNPDDERDESLQQRAWQIVQPIFQQTADQARARYLQLAGTGRTVTRPEDIVPAAWASRVETLFVALEAHAWGHFDAEAGMVRMEAAPEADSQDLLDFAALQTMLHGGAVYAVPAGEVPGGSPVAAILRYG